LLPEDSYGRRKRLEFVARVVRAQRPARVLDVGCGTGAYLTIPLGEMFPEVTIVGTDDDTASLDHARAAPHPKNVSFAGAVPQAPFDLVIASEVLEHVDDPPSFLSGLAARVRPGGRLIVTVPNGYGPFEALALTEVLLNLSGAQRLLRRLRGRPAITPTANTLAVSPHVNFFSLAALRRLFAAAGLAVESWTPTSFLCGYGIDHVVRGARVVAWNVRAADALPAWCASGWMFELSLAAPAPARAWRRNAWGRFRRRLNRRRWGLA
jgi:2-polyprenyl-3-methyl-5-hydroxy-6-metoxy-1,4-benzoquinol methylase